MCFFPGKTLLAFCFWAVASVARPSWNLAGHNFAPAEVPHEHSGGPRRAESGERTSCCHASGIRPTKLAVSPVGESAPLERMIMIRLGGESFAARPTRSQDSPRLSALSLSSEPYPGTVGIGGTPRNVGAGF